MKRPIFFSIVACSAVFGLLLSCGNTQAAPLTLTAEVKATTLVRADGTPPTVITLRRNQVFIISGFSTRAGDSVDIIFTKGGESFRLDAVEGALGADLSPLLFYAIPLKGPATVTIFGKGLVAYEIQTL